VGGIWSGSMVVDKEHYYEALNVLSEAHNHLIFFVFFQLSIRNNEWKKVLEGNKSLILIYHSEFYMFINLLFQVLDNNEKQSYGLGKVVSEHLSVDGKRNNIYNYLKTWRDKKVSHFDKDFDQELNKFETPNDKDIYYFFLDIFDELRKKYSTDYDAVYINDSGQHLFLRDLENIFLGLGATGEFRPSVIIYQWGSERVKN
jgi:hypothetical protein